MARATDRWYYRAKCVRLARIRTRNWGRAAGTGNFFDLGSLLQTRPASNWVAICGSISCKPRQAGRHGYDKITFHVDTKHFDFLVSLPLPIVTSITYCQVFGSITYYCSYPPTIRYRYTNGLPVSLLTTSEAGVVDWRMFIHYEMYCKCNYVYMFSTLQGSLSSVTSWSLIHLPFVRSTTRGSFWSAGKIPETSCWRSCHSSWSIQLPANQSHFLGQAGMAEQEYSNTQQPNQTNGSNFEFQKCVLYSARLWEMPLGGASSPTASASVRNSTIAHDSKSALSSPDSSL